LNESKNRGFILKKQKPADKTYKNEPAAHHFWFQTEENFIPDSDRQLPTPRHSLRKARLLNTLRPAPAPRRGYCLPPTE